MTLGVLAEKSRVGRKRSDVPMASTRLSEASYEVAKKVAKLKGQSAVTYISKVVQKAALADLADLIQKLKSEGEDEIESLKASRRAQIKELESILKPGN